MQTHCHYAVEKQEKWWENVIELGAKVWRIAITDSGKTLQIVTNQELRNAFINSKTDLNHTKDQ